MVQKCYHCSNCIVVVRSIYAIEVFSGLSIFSLRNIFLVLEVFWVSVLFLSCLLKTYSKRIWKSCSQCFVMKNYWHDFWFSYTVYLKVHTTNRLIMLAIKVKSELNILASERKITFTVLCLTRVLKTATRACIP